jgi:large subunit ribosomal protein L21
MPEILDKPYAVIKTGDELLVERLSDDEGATVTLQTLLVAGGGKDASFGEAAANATVTATVIGHERGPKIRVFKYKPKRGYKKTMGHRQELTRLRVEKIA